MKVKLLVSRAGVMPNGIEFSQSAGQEIEIDRKNGQRIVEAGQAEFISLSEKEIAEDKAAEAEAKKAEAKKDK